MAIIDFPDESPDVGTSLRLGSNSTEFVSELNNATQDARMIGDQWGATMPFSNRPKLIGRKMKAFLARLGGKSGRFRMTPPDLDQLGTMQGAGVVDGAGQTGTTLNTKGWVAGQANLFEIGDYIAFNGELKVIVDMAQSLGDYIEYSGTNYMPSPFDPSGWLGAVDFDLSYTSSTESNPSGESFVGEFEQIGTNSANLLSTGFIQTMVSGEYAYFSMVFKEIQGMDSIRCFFQYEDGGTQSDGSPFIKLSDGSGILPNGWETKVTSLSNGYSLLEVKMLANFSFDYRSIIYLQNGSVIPTIGDKIKLQAAYFGKSDTWPANYLEKQALEIAPPIRKATNDGDAIETTNPQAIFKLTSDQQADWDLQANYIYSASINCIEDVT